MLHFQILKLFSSSEDTLSNSYKAAKIEYDPAKAAANPLNHDGVTFDEAKPVLLDPYVLTREDVDADGEQRFITLGMGAKGRVLIVVWTQGNATTMCA